MFEIFQELKLFLDILRIKDSIIMSGGPLLGILFTLNSINYAITLRIILFMLAVLLGIGHIFTLNDWLGYNFDKYNPKKINTPLLVGRVSLSRLRLLCLTLGGLCLFLFFILSFKVFVLAILIIFCGICYDHPRILLKGIPLVDVVINALGGSFLFLLGYTLFNPLDIRGVLISLYFAFLISGGYLIHAVMDYESDMRLNIHTFAVKFGRERALDVSLVIFTLSNLYFFLLGIFGVIPFHLCIIPVVIYPIYLYLFFSTIKKKKNKYNFDIARFIKNYRKLYTFMGIYLSIALICGLAR